MESLRQDKQRLHDATGRYIIEKNNFENRIKSLETDLADCQQKLKDSNSTTVTCSMRMIQE